MGSVIISMLPLALASIAPVMITLVVLLLGLKDGFSKATAFVLGKTAAYLVIGYLIFQIGGQLSSDGGDSSEQSTVISAVKLVLGVIFLVLAAKTLLGEPDPDATPPKLLTKLQTANPVVLFAAGFGLSFIQIRFILLMMAGVGIIKEADLGTTSDIITLVVLVLAMVWTLIVPLIMYKALGDKADATMSSLNEWLGRNSRWINVIVLTLFGLVMLRSGIQGIF